MWNVGHVDCPLFCLFVFILRFYCCSFRVFIRFWANENWRYCYSETRSRIGLNYEWPRKNRVTILATARERWQRGAFDNVSLRWSRGARRRTTIGPTWNLAWPDWFAFASLPRGKRTESRLAWLVCFASLPRGKQTDPVCSAPWVQSHVAENPYNFLP